MTTGSQFGNAAGCAIRSGVRKRIRMRERFEKPTSALKTRPKTSTSGRPKEISGDLNYPMENGAKRGRGPGADA